jgi:methylenetetrahydrofolate dehydrogenase (NADP+)/methenyltetrahydrofolate cyclohydrolase
MILISGKEIASQLKEELKQKVEDLHQKNIKKHKVNRYPKLAIIQVGNNEASNTYVKNKIKTCEYCNVIPQHILFPDDVTQEQLISEINYLNSSYDVDGIIVQLPLPKHLDEYKIINTICPEKDVDGFTNVNLGKVMNDDNTGFIPATPKGICTLIDRYKIPTENKNVVIIGRSNTVGRPLANLLSNKKYNANVTLLHSKTDWITLRGTTMESDIIIACCGQKEMINKDYLSNNKIYTIIDVGIHRNNDNKLCGDVDFESVKQYCEYITPVPGGVGPMTVIELINNTIKSYAERYDLRGV